MEYSQVRKESLEQNEFTQYPIIPARRYVRYWNEIESKKKHQKEIIIEEIKNNYELKGEKFASMACRAAIKANDRIQSMEIRSLLNELETCENPFTCPHGRPTIVEITKTEIEKMFKRIM